MDNKRLIQSFDLCRFLTMNTNNKNKKINTVLVVLFALYLSSALILTILRLFGLNYNGPVLDEKAYKTEQIVSSGNIIKDFDAFFEASFPYRNTIISIHRTDIQRFEAPYRHGLYKLLSEKLYSGYSRSFLAPLIDGETLYGREDWLFFTGGDSVKYYRNKKPLSEEMMSEWLASFEALESVCNEKGIRLAIIIAPNKEQVYGEYMPSYTIESGPKRDELLEQYVTENSNINFCYLIDEMKASKSTREIYYRQDTHWNNLGAFAGVMSVYESLGLPITDIEDVQIIETVKSGGDISNFCGYITDYPDYIIDYNPEIEPQQESLEGGTFRSFCPERTGKLVWIGDSFKNYVTKYISKDFKQTLILHRDYTERNYTIEMLKSLGRGDILVMEAVERFDYTLAPSCLETAEILKNSFS